MPQVCSIAAAADLAPYFGIPGSGWNAGTQVVLPAAVIG